MHSYLKITGALFLALTMSSPAFSNSNTNGNASWYGPGFHGKKAASGETFNQNALTAAHRTLKFGTIVRVTYPKTGKSVDVRINDRGPFHGNRIIDLSKAAATEIGLIGAGVGKVEIKVVNK